MYLVNSKTENRKTLKASLRARKGKIKAKQGCTLWLRSGYAMVFQTVAVSRSPSLPKNFSVDTLCKMQA